MILEEVRQRGVSEAKERILEEIKLIMDNNMGPYIKVTERARWQDCLKGLYDALKGEVAGG